VRAARFHAARDLRVEEAGPPGDPGSEQVLIRPLLCGICGTDLHEYVAGPIVTSIEPHPLTGASNPQILGHELSAEVVAVGAGVQSVSPGDRVAVMPLIFCQRCWWCRRGLNHLCERMGCTGLSSDWGGMAEHALVNEYQVARLPDELSDEQGALIEPTAVATYAVDRGQVRPGDSVLIAGLGPIGALVSLVARAAGAGAVYASEPNPRRARRAVDLELADEVLDPSDGLLTERLAARTEGVGVDVAIECAGHEAALNSCVDAVRPAGTVVQAGLFVSPATVEPFQWASKDITIEGTWCFRVQDWPRIIAAVATRRLPVERVVTRRIGLDDAVEGFDSLIDPDGDEIKIHVAVRGAS
jgi:(R,R)-butanediol dehydrogenase/meso-butanediol dehydrogenase/diacetyl reductase